jgi:hypothetical protein
MLQEALLVYLGTGRLEGFFNGENMTITPFDNEEDAVRKVASLNNYKDNYLKYCPLIKDKCRTDCECWVPARYDPVNKKYNTFSKGDDYQYRVYLPHCGNAMFTEKEIYYNG